MMPNPYESPEDAVEARLIEDGMACPQCSSTMQYGVVVPTGHLYWLENDQHRTILPPSAKIPNTGPGLLRPNRISSFRCAECNLVVVRHGSGDK